MSSASVPKVARGQGGALDALRFAASLLIVLYHFGDDAPTALQSLHPVFGRGYLATDFFLMLSGYVLGRGYGDKVVSGVESAASFLKRRLLRIWPGHLIVLAAFFVIVEAGLLVHLAPNHPGDFTLKALVLQALLVQAWGFSGGHGWNEPTWSLSAFVVCYAAFPIVWRAIARLKSPGAVLALGLTAVMGANLVSQAALSAPVYDLPIEHGLLRALPLFLFGMTLARLATLVKAPSALAVAGAIGFVALQALGRYDLASVLCIAAIMLGVSGEPRRPSALITQAGRISFALFITHILTAMLWFHPWRIIEQRLDLADPARWVIWAAAVPVAVIVAVLFDRFVDQPVQKLIANLRARPGRYPAPARSG